MLLVIIQLSFVELDEKLKEDIESRVMHLNVGKQFYVDMNRSIKNNVVDTTDFYGKPDIRYYLDEYVRFPNMEEVFAEIIVVNARNPQMGSVNA